MTPMTEPQDVLAEALHANRISSEDFYSDYAEAILAVLAARGYALVRTPETLDALRVTPEEFAAALRTPKPEGETMSDHDIRTTSFAMESHRPFCVNCGRFVSHVAFTAKGKLVDFAVHVGPVPADWQRRVANARAWPQVWP